MKLFTIITAAVVATLLTSATALAATITYTDRASWQAAISDPIVTESFDGLGLQTFPSTGVTDIGPFTVATFDTGGGAGIFDTSGSIATVSGTRFLQVHSDGDPVESTSILLPEPIYGFGFDFASVGDGTQLTFADISELDIRPIVGTSGFIGFISDQMFQQIDFTDRYASYNFTGIDDFSTVPEPAALSLLGLGGLALLRRRRVG